jgi:hypothetical protein
MRATRLLIPAALAAALLAPSGAAAGGFATVGVNPPPDGIGTGKTWHVELTILQHGHTPLDGVKPSVIVSRGAVQRTFSAQPAGRPGVYAAEVVFPSAGTWRYAVEDGFTMSPHTFPPVRVGDGGVDGLAVAAPAARPTAPPLEDGPDIALALALAAVAGLAAGIGASVLQRRGPRPASQSG